jgi:hypothetical protein
MLTMSRWSNGNRRKSRDGRSPGRGSATANTLKEGWLHTGEMASQVEKSFTTPALRPTLRKLMMGLIADVEKKKP